MKKTPKVVVPLNSHEARVIASDEQCQRLIVGIGNRRIAFDFFTRISDLPPETGDRPAPVLPMKENGTAAKNDELPENSHPDHAVQEEH